MNEDKDKDCLNLENNSKCCFFKVANAFMLGAVFILVVILCFYAPRVISGNSLGFDYMGVIVGILAILVTALIGWQIWQAVDVNKRLKKQEEQFNLFMQDWNEVSANSQAVLNQKGQFLEVVQQYCDASALMATAMLQSNQVNEFVSEKDCNFGKAYELYAQALAYYCYNGGLLFVKNCIKGMEKCLDEIDKHNTWDRFPKERHSNCDKYFGVIKDKMRYFENDTVSRLSRLRDRRNEHEKDAKTKTEIGID